MTVYRVHEGCFCMCILSPQQKHVAKATRQALCFTGRQSSCLVSISAGSGHQQQDCCSAQSSHTQRRCHPSNNKGQEGPETTKNCPRALFVLHTCDRRCPKSAFPDTTGDREQGPTGIVWVIVVLHSWAPGTVLRHSLFKACQYPREHQSISGYTRGSRTAVAEPFRSRARVCLPVG
jgi:hypothetical protein